MAIKISAIFPTKTILDTWTTTNNLLGQINSNTISGLQNIYNAVVPIFNYLNAMVKDISFSGALVWITEPHYQVHIGKFFEFSDDPVSVGAGSSADELLFITGVSSMAHITIQLREILAGNSNGTGMMGARLEIYEDVETDSDGTQQRVFNRYRLSANSADATVFLMPVINSYGRLIYSEVINPSLSTEKALRETYEFILGEGGHGRQKKYLFRIYNLDSDYTQNFQLILNWYEIEQ